MGCACASDDRKDFPQGGKESSAASQTPRPPAAFPTRRLTKPLCSSFRAVATVYEEGFVKVTLSQHVISNHQCFVKCYTLGEGQDLKTRKKAALREAKILSIIDHPHVVKLHEVLEDAQHIYLLTEPSEVGNLQKYLLCQSMSELQAAEVMRAVFSIVAHCHAKGIMLRGLASEHLHFAGSQFDVKLADTGEARLTNAPHQGPTRHVTDFLAPEALSSACCEKSDLWSCGVLLFHLVSGESPYACDSQSSLANFIRRGKVFYSERRWVGRSREIRDLLDELFDLDPAARPTALSCLSGPWMKRFYQADHSKLQISPSEIASCKPAAKWKLAVCRFIIERVMSGAQLAALRQSFQALDSDGDGLLSADDLMTGCEKTLDKSEAKAQVTRILKAVNLDKDSLVSYSEFLVSSMRKELVYSPGNLRMAFGSLDSNHDGFLSVSDLRSVVPADCVGEMEAAIQVVGLSADSISAENFLSLLQS